MAKQVKSMKVVIGGRNVTEGLFAQGSATKDPVKDLEITLDVLPGVGTVFVDEAGKFFTINITAELRELTKDEAIALLYEKSEQKITKEDIQAFEAQVEIMRKKAEEVKAAAAIPQDYKNVDAMKQLERMRDDVQRIRIATNNRIFALRNRGILTEAQAQTIYGVSLAHLQECELLFGKALVPYVEARGVWQSHLQYVKGIGTTLASRIISCVEQTKQVRTRMADGTDAWRPVMSLITDKKKLWALPDEDGEIDDETAGDEQGAKRMIDPIQKPELLIEGLAAKYPGETLVQPIEVRTGIACFDNPSKLVAYAGWHNDGQGQPVKRHAGEQGNWNPKLKTAVYVATTCFIKAGGRYKQLYDDYKRQDNLKHPEMTDVPVLSNGQPVLNKDGTPRMRKLYRKSHMHARAMRYTAKRFLINLWAAWRQAENLPTITPWILAHSPEHTTYVSHSEFEDKRVA